MSKYRSAGYRRAARGSKIRAWLHHKQMAELITDNANVFVPKPKADAVVIIRIRGQPQMQFSTYKTPWNSWTISPTLAGKKIQQVLMRA